MGLILAAGLFSLPSFLALDLKIADASKVNGTDFPVTVDPESKTITEDPAVDALLDKNPSALSASAENATSLFSWVASTIAALPLYQQLAASDVTFVTIHPGDRKEQVADEFGRALGWSTVTRAAFLTQARTKPPTLTEGEFTPGTYLVSEGATPSNVQALIYDRFTKDIISRYSTTTAEQVPIDQALTIASLLERESGNTADMRLISGVIWNRIFNNMNLQLDATLQYAKANTTNTKSWWPQPIPADKYIKSTYNTYMHPGLPPGPIASPSVAAVLAALNPKKTDCLFYFHDSHGVFHCSPTYAGHVALLKKYYGQGK